MKIKQEKQERAYAIKYIAEYNGKEAGRVFLYIIYNDLHDEPYGLMEDLFVEEEFRGKGIGRELVEKVINGARTEGCRKLLAQSRYGREKIHSFYKNRGFKDHGKNFRMDIIENM